MVFSSDRTHKQRIRHTDYIFLVKLVGHDGFFLPVAWSVEVCDLYIKFKEYSVHGRSETSGIQIRFQANCFSQNWY